MTRNEWIAETAREYRVHGRWGSSMACLETFPTMTEAIDAATVDAVAFEERGVAPWHNSSSQARATVAYEVEEGVFIAGHLWPRTGDPAFTRKAVAAINAACNAPALTDTTAKVVEAAGPFIESLGHALFTPEGITLRDAVRAHLAAKQGGAS